MIVVFQQLVPDSEYPEKEKHPAMRYLSRIDRFFLKKSFQYMKADITYPGTNYTRRMKALGFGLVQALHRAGAKLLLGTDAGNPFVFPGYSAHQELGYMVRAGLSAYEALRTATVNAAESLGQLDRWGTVEVGKVADLILVEANPLDDVRNLGSQQGVMLRGRWFTAKEMEAVLDRLAN